MSDAPRAEGEFEVAAELGLHLRPAGEFVTLAGSFDCEVQVGRGEEWADGCSVMSLVCLAASRGTKLVIKAEGPDAERAVAALGELLERA